MINYALLIAPGGGPQWMPKPEVPGCPPGLEYLTQIDQLLVHQAVQLLDGKLYHFINEMSIGEMHLLYPLPEPF